MNMETLKRCPSTLADGFSTYSPEAQKKLFNKKAVSHILPYDTISKDEEAATEFLQNRKRISLSGAQSKYSLIADNNVLRLTNIGEQGTHILKPVPNDVRLSEDCAANENLTMQIASQVFGMDTAANGLCFFQSGESAYLTKRFDITPDGSKLQKEDFASLASLTTENAGADYKYDQLSYEDIADLIKKYIIAWKIELRNFFDMVVFNYLFSNGDAHLKNFSILETRDGDYKLAPAYDMMDTKLHVDDKEFALDKGLFKSPHPEWMKMGTQVNGETFKQWGVLIGLSEKTVEKELAKFTSHLDEVLAFIKQSYLSEKAKSTYETHYRTRRNKLIDRKI